MEGIKITKIPANDEIGRIVRDEFANEFCDDYYLFGEEETCLPRYYAKFAESIQNFEVKNSDIWVCTYPKTGTTWTQEMVWLIANDLDYEEEKSNLWQRYSFLELSTMYDFEKLDQALGIKSPESVTNSVEDAKTRKNPRFIKTHLPFSLLPEEIQNGSKLPKIINVVRNPKDVCISYYHHGKLLENWKASLQNFSKVFMTNKIHYGSFWKHVFGYWAKRDSPNLLIIAYEDMKNDLPSVIQKVARFLNKNLTKKQIDGLCKHLSFESMKNNEAVNVESLINLRKEKNLTLEDGSFIRSGTVGKYKEELSPEIIEKLEAWIKESISETSFGEQYDYNL